MHIYIYYIYIYTHIYIHIYIDAFKKSNGFLMRCCKMIGSRVSLATEGHEEADPLESSSNVEAGW